MEPKQVVLLVVFGGVFTLVAAAVLGRRIRVAPGALAAGVAALGGLAAIWPNATTRAAAVLGVDRGADLVAYATTVVVFVGFLTMYIKLRRVRTDVTRLVRQLAIANARENPGVANDHTDTPSSQAGRTVDERRVDPDR